VDKDRLNEKVALALQKGWQQKDEQHFGDIAVYVFGKKEQT